MGIVRFPRIVVVMLMTAVVVRAGVQRGRAPGRRRGPAGVHSAAGRAVARVA